MLTSKWKSNPVWPAVLLAAVVLACLAPFANKPFNVDDPLFLWTARHIQSSPLDFYGFKVNWFGTPKPMTLVQQNPPLAAYYIALVAKLSGWSRPVLHMAFFAFAVAAALGTYFLARRLTSRPLTAVLAGVLTPVFLISANTVMCDMMATAFWVWAVYFWMRGVSEKAVPNMLLASVFAAACGLSKYVGVSLIPLLLCYSLAKKRPLGACFLLIPAAVFAGYEWYTRAMYGTGLLLDAASYSAGALSHYADGTFLRLGLSNIITGLVFVGGCLISAFFYSFLIWRKKTAITGVFLVAALVSLIHIRALLFPPALARYQSDQFFHWLFIAQFYLFALGGASVLALSVRDLWRSKNPESLLLFLWVSGIFIFLTLLNWTVNARTVLLMFPAVGILLARAAVQKKNGISGRNKGNVLVLIPLIPALAVSLAAARADYKWARSAHAEASSITRNYNGAPGRLWFMGHWGFQYYMQRHGAKPLDFAGTVLRPGDTVIIPQNNTNTLLPYHFTGAARITETRNGSSSWLATMNWNAGAGFYSDKTSGPLPFIIAPVPGEKYYILHFVRPFFLSR